MAEDKKGFLLYADQKELFDQLPNEKAGELIKHIFKYVNDENPESDDLLINLSFTSIKQQLKRDLKKYEDRIDKKSTSGREGNLKRWNKDVYDDYKKGNQSLEDAELYVKNRKTSHTDKVRSHHVANIAVNDTVTVNDNVKVIDKVIKEKIVYSQAVHECFNYSLNYFPKELHPKKKEIWLDTLEKLNRIDGYSFEDIKTVIKKTREDSFWSKNFLSIKKLRNSNKDGIKYYQVFKNQNNEQRNNNTEQKPTRGEELEDFIKQYGT